MRLSLKLFSKLAIITALCIWQAGCADSDASQTQGDAQQSNEMANQTPAEQGPIRFGLVPSEGGTDIVERFKPMITQLEQELGRPVEAFSATEYLGIITAMQNKQVDLVYLGPKSYVEASRIAGAVAIVKELNLEGLEGYFGIIITNKSTGIKTLADAKGHSFGFTTPNSTSGYLIPAIGIVDETGMPAEAYFSQVQYTGTHGNAVRAVLAGDLEVAATNTLDLRAMERAGLDASELVEIWRSPIIPASLIAVRDDLPMEFRDQVTEALVKLNEDHQAMETMSRGGFVPATDEEYDIIRVLEQRKAEMAAASDG
ncbi:MAG: phosphonate ABC transporter substrate-binding protein [Phycisphaerae bacterium]|nr:phosphonate ABC transporter substrate-binding protein [Phycisphaerae bacterium]HCT45090.1 phosphonate ABC transporter substrate-binding protein [Phycisphaerales bacterium]|tara:strand:+ start:513 stop:1454 length:942 start_codon:yes stop_codon:yes gene_type:complete